MFECSKQLRTIDRNAGGPLQDYLTEMFDLTVSLKFQTFKLPKCRLEIIDADYLCTYICIVYTYIYIIYIYILHWHVASGLPHRDVRSNGTLVKLSNFLISFTALSLRSRTLDTLNLGLNLWEFEYWTFWNVFFWIFETRTSRRRRRVRMW